MPNTYTQIFVHIVFTVQRRQNLIAGSHREELQKYISGIVRNREQKLLAISCMPDHTHLLIGLKPSISISDLVRDIKATSSKFLNERKWVRGRFSWQEGFGAFSYSKSQIEKVIKYIVNQEQHHRKRTFREEYLQILRESGVQYDEKYLFDWIA